MRKCPHASAATARRRTATPASAGATGADPATPHSGSAGFAIATGTGAGAAAAAAATMGARICATLRRKHTLPFWKDPTIPCCLLLAEGSATLPRVSFTHTNSPSGGGSGSPRPLIPFGSDLARTHICFNAAQRSKSGKSFPSYHNRQTLYKRLVDFVGRAMRDFINPVHMLLLDAFRLQQALQVELFDVDAAGAPPFLPLADFICQCFSRFTGRLWFTHPALRLQLPQQCVRCSGGRCI